MFCLHMCAMHGFATTAQGLGATIYALANEHRLFGKAASVFQYLIFLLKVTKEMLGLRTHKI